jgi:hypothetical protein
MPEHTDVELLHALVHDAHLLCAGAPDVARTDVARIKEQLGIAELIMSNAATDKDRSRVYEILHPATLHLYLP